MNIRDIESLVSSHLVTCFIRFTSSFWDLKMVDGCVEGLSRYHEVRKKLYICSPECPTVTLTAPN